MQIERQSVSGAEVLAIQGQLDATTAPQLEGALEDAADHGGGRPLVVDLAGVGLISSAALRVLLSAAKRARRESGKIHLCAANPEVRKVFEISGLAALFELHDTQEGALASTSSRTAAEPPPAPAPAPAIETTAEYPFETPAEEPVVLAPGPEAAELPLSPPLPAPEPPSAAPEPLSPEPTAPEPEFNLIMAPETTVEPPVLPVPPISPVSAPVSPFAAPLPVPPSNPPPPVPPPTRPRTTFAPPPPAPARVPTLPTPAPSAIRKPFPVFPLIAGTLGLGLLLAALGYFLFNRLAPKTGLAGVPPAPVSHPELMPTPSPEASILPMDAPTPEPTASTPVTAPAIAASSPTPTPTPALVGSGPASASGDPQANRIAAPAQVNFDPSDPRNSAVREGVLKRIESMPVTRKVKDQLYAALERARGMGKVATITFGTARTDLSPSDVETLRKGLAQPVTAKLTADPTVVIVVLGYADTKGDAAANRKLSEQRASRTMEALKGPCGLLNIMHSVGMGPSELLDGKNSDANRAVEVWAVQP